MVAGTSSVVIVPLVSKIKIDRRVALTLSLESEITDALNVIILFSIVHAYVLGVITVGEVVTSIVSSFSIGTVLGFLFGLLWLNILHFVRREEYVYMLTVAAVLLCYTTVEWLTGSGILSVLLFGLVLGNDKRFIDFLKLKINPLTKKMKTFLASFQAELSFLIRAFFFVFLGLLYQFSLVGLAFALAFVAITLAARHFAVAASLFRSPLNTSKNKNFMTLMSGRGLAAATLSTIPLQFDLPNAMLYVMIVANVILISNILMVIPLWMIKKKKRV
jgi:cell volume regulation protein A